MMPLHTAPNQDRARADDLANALVAPLAEPGESDSAASGQSLSRGPAGIALAHIEHAHHDVPEARQRLHRWARAATAHPISSSESAGLHAGLPAISFLLHLAEPVMPEYHDTTAALDTHLLRLAHHRVDAALDRIRRGRTPAFTEYDLLRGLTGIGQLLLHHMPSSDALPRVLGYLVQLSEPITVQGDVLPGWWVEHDPDPLLPTPGGHTNLGMAHGIAGPLALLSHALRRGITVDGHQEAIARFCEHFDHWRHDDEAGSWWPYWIDRHDHARGRIAQHEPARPSWCYGTPGITRAQQLAGIAAGDTTRQHTAEAALLDCFADHSQLALITDQGLCHGWSGLYLTAAHAADDAGTPDLAAQLPPLAEYLTEGAAHTAPPELGLLDGATGTALALKSAATQGLPRSGWEQCLLIT